MGSIKRHKVLYDSSAANTGEWFRLDNRYDQDAARILQISITTGDTITMQLATKDVRGSTPAEVTSLIEADDITNVAYTATVTDTNLLRGPWTYIRVVKTGTTGNAKVQGFI